MAKTATEIRLTIGGRLGATDTTGFRVAEHLLVWTISSAVGFTRL
jgi:hypothetical protein